MMDILTHTEKQVIELRFFRRYRWEMVASSVGYSQKHCYRLQNSAITKLEVWPNKNN